MKGCNTIQSVSPFNRVLFKDSVFLCNFGIMLQNTHPFSSCKSLRACSEYNIVKVMGWTLWSINFRNIGQCWAKVEGVVLERVVWVLCEFRMRIYANLGEDKGLHFCRPYWRAFVLF